jgi:hypothetical protein
LKVAHRTKLIALACCVILIGFVIAYSLPPSGKIDLVLLSGKGTNLVFVLRPADNPLAVERENHSEIVWLRDGTIISNHSQSGFTTLTAVRPRESWSFKTTVPPNAAAVQGSVDCKQFSKLHWSLAELRQRMDNALIAEILEKLVDTMSAKTMTIQSAIWIKDGDNWVEAGRDSSGTNSERKTTTGETPHGAEFFRLPARHPVRQCFRALLNCCSC